MTTLPPSTGSTIFATSDDEIRSAFPVMRQLRPHLEEAAFVATVRAAERLGLRIVLHVDDGRVVAVAGFRLLDQLKSGLVLYVDDLVTDEAERSKRYGDALLDWLVVYAKEQHCVAFELDSGVHRFAAHRFYFRKRMHISAYHFMMEL
jgi:GNAT superfamily N-acetyltransferase